jgi:hypothetical protein
MVTHQTTTPRNKMITARVLRGRANQANQTANAAKAIAIGRRSDAHGRLE